jgi:hypothetical protein
MGHCPGETIGPAGPGHHRDRDTHSLECVPYVPVPPGRLVPGRHGPNPRRRGRRDACRRPARRATWVFRRPASCRVSCRADARPSRACRRCAPLDQTADRARAATSCPPPRAALTLPALCAATPAPRCRLPKPRLAAGRSACATAAAAPACARARASSTSARPTPAPAATGRAMSGSARPVASRSRRAPASYRADTPAPVVEIRPELPRNSILRPQNPRISIVFPLIFQWLAACRSA